MCNLRLAPPRFGPAYTASPAQGTALREPAPRCAPTYTAAPICGGQQSVATAGAGTAAGAKSEVMPKSQEGAATR